MDKLYLVDISSFIFRAYYAIRPLSAQDGTPVNAVFGVVNMVNKLINTHNPDHVIVCNDLPGPGFRNEIFPEYKANRGAPPEDLIPQFDLIKEFVSKYPLVAIHKEGYEADDIIATLVHKYKKKKDMEIYIVSSDKDLMQLIDDNVFMYDSMKEKILKHEAVMEKFGVTPDKVVDIQSLCGDAVDNIPGIPGVGPKTATKLINQYGSLEGVLEHAHEIKGKLGEKVMAGKEGALLSRKLVSLDCNVDLGDLNWADMKRAEPDQASLNDFYTRLNFTKLVKDVPGVSSPKKTTQTAQFVLLETVQKLEGVASNIKMTKPKVLAFDTETDSKNSIGAQLVGISFCYDKKTAYYVPVAHKTGQNVPLEDIKRILGPILSDPALPKAAQNAKYDLNVLSQYNLPVTPLGHDTMIASYLCDPAGKHSLDFLAEMYLGHSTIKFSDVVPKGQTFADVPLDAAKDYAAEDAWLTFSLLKPLNKELKETKVASIYSELEVPLVSVLAKMEQNGIMIDIPFLDGLEKEFSSRLAKLEKTIYKLAGEEFNINSPKQLSVILFENLKLPVVKKTKTGYSTDVTVLTELASQHELPAKLLEFRSITKLLSTYVIQLKNLLNQKSKRVHTSFNQAIAATGRLSSTDPNLQNIPIKTEEGRRIREAFIVPKGSVLYSADYSQIELRLLAEFTQDKSLVEAYQNDEDIHAKTASKILGVDLTDVDGPLRNIGKTINFGVVYGQTPFGLAKQLDVPQSEAKAFIEGFYREFHGVKEYREKILEDARKEGFVQTYMGRRRYLPDLNSKNKMVKQNAERVAFNTVFQGSAADLIKQAMIQIQTWLDKEKLTTKMVLQVHDELIFEVPHKELDIIRKKVPEMMSGAFDLKVPLKVSANHGKNWAEAH